MEAEKTFLIVVKLYVPYLAIRKGREGKREIISERCKKEEVNLRDDETIGTRGWNRGNKIKNLPTHGSS
jgi:hypothetical protein